MIRRHRDIKPKLTSAHTISRLEYVLTKLRKDRGRWRVTDNKNIAHGDGKWFYRLKDGAVCRVFPNRDGIYKTPAGARIYHKTRIPKVMVLAVCARPRPEYGFDSKVGMFSFT